MNRLLFANLICPHCAEAFWVWDQVTAVITPANKPLRNEVVAGLLKCANNHVFPIVASIPRIFPGGLQQAPQLAEPNQRGFPADWADAVSASLHVANIEFRASFAATQESFNSEWETLGEDESAWGQSVDDRLALFLESFRINKADLAGKRVLDAGCGHGENTLALAAAGAQVFAIDLSSSVDIVARRLQKAGLYDAAQLVQTNLVQPPFPESSFDFVYSAGVLHHTPNTKNSFAGIAPLAKPGGLTFIEVYSNEFKNWAELAIHYIFRAFRRLTLLLPLPVLHVLCWILAVPLWVYVHSFNWLKREIRYIPRSLRAAELSLFDALSPRYDWHHTTEEVRRWFAEEGYRDLQRTYENHNCIGIVGKRLS